MGSALECLTLMFDNHLPVMKVTYKGREAVITQELGKLCWYSSDGSKLVNQMTGKDWSKEFTEGIDFQILKGRDLQDLRELTRSDRVAKNLIDAKTRHLLLYGPGVALVLQKTEKPIGIRARRLLADNFQSWGHLAGRICPELSDAQLQRMIMPEVYRPYKDVFPPGKTTISLKVEICRIVRN